MKNVNLEDDTCYLFFHDFVSQKDSFIKNMGKADTLKLALKEDRITLAFQPVVASKSGEIVYHECLLRMEGMEDEITSIGDYILAAEKFRLINAVDELVLELVVNELVNYSDIKLSVNVSAFGISKLAWMKKAKQLLTDREISNRLIIEITETIAQRDFQKSIRFVKELQELGCKVSLDDFGSGYTSFSQLKLLPVNMRKIDAIFTKDLMSNSDNEFFIKSVVELNKALKRLVVAEYVETEEIAQKLIDLGVDELQGYFFGKPTVSPIWREISK